MAASNYGQLERAAAKQYGIPLDLFRRLIQMESGGNQGAVSPAGAIGLTQLMPKTAAGLGVDPSDPAQNLMGGARYLRQQYDTFGRWDLALAAYNAGPNAVKEAGGIPAFPETQRYVKNILSGASTKAPSAPAMQEGFNTLAGGTPDLSGVALTNLSTRDPLEQLTNLTNAVAAGGTAAPAVETPQAPQRQGRLTRKEQGVTNLVSQYLGVPYQWGGSTPKGFDCSGLLQFVWAKQGVEIPRTTYDQWQTGAAVRRGALRAGDAVFFRGSDARGNLPGHVGIYIGAGKFIEAPHTGASVRVSKLAGRTDYVGARRYG